MIFFGLVILGNSLFFIESAEGKLFGSIIGIVFIIIGYLKSQKEAKIEKETKENYRQILKKDAEQGNYRSKQEYLQFNRRDKLFNTGNRCEKCGSYVNLHVHHIKPKSIGGTDDISNLQVLCKRCHENTHGFKIEDEKIESGYNRSNPIKQNKKSIIIDAINKKSKIAFTYKKYNGDISKRSVKPINLYIEKNRQYLLAYDFSRNANRVFRISRMTDISEDK